MIPTVPNASTLWRWYSNFAVVLMFLVCGLVLVVSIIYLWTALRTPGPWGIPIMGYYPFLRKDFHVQLHEFTKKYGDAYIINIAGQNMLYLGTYKALKEAHVNKADAFPSRGHKPSLLQHSLEDSISFLEGEQWKEQRDFVLQNLRKIALCMEDDELQDPMKESILCTLDALYNSKGQVVNASSLIYKQCTNIIQRTMLGEEMPEDIITKLNEAYFRILAPMTGTNFLYVGNYARNIVLPEIPGFIDMMVATDEMLIILDDILQQHKATFDFDSQPRDFIDFFLQERVIRRRNDDPTADYFTDISLVASLLQFYGDGSVSIGVFVAVYLHWLCRRPDIQDAIFAEVSSVIGTDRLPTWDDKPNLPLTNSTLKEILRTTKFAVAFPDLECARSTTVLGVPVSKGTVTLVNVWAIHRDPKAYPNPDVIDITRYLPGRKESEPPITFGLGERRCLGQKLVMTQICLFVTAIVQNFVIFPETMGHDMGPFNFDRDVKLRAYPRPGGRYSFMSCD